jgi:hypothetical protein
MRVMQGMGPLALDLHGKFSAQECEGGLVLSVLTSAEDGKDKLWPVSQSQANKMVVNKQGQFEVPFG